MSKQPNLKKWSEIRKKGKWNYIVNHGLLRFGMSTYVMILIYYWVFQSELLNLTLAMVFLFTFPLAGLIWGKWMWFYLEKLYAQLPESIADRD